MSDAKIPLALVLNTLGCITVFVSPFIATQHADKFGMFLGVWYLIPTLIPFGILIAISLWSIVYKRSNAALIFAILTLGCAFLPFALVQLF